MSKEQKPFVIAGLQSAGKTNLILSMIAYGKSQGRNYAAFKPFDLGIITANATESDTDSEKFCEAMAHEPMTTLVTPYIAHEEYPIEMSFRRDGIKVDPKLLESRLHVLNQTYDQTLIELPSGIMTPITESINSLEWAKELQAPLLYLLSPVLGAFEAQMAEIQILKESGLEFSFAFNNPVQPKDADYQFYLWEAVEKLTGLQAEGMFPFVDEVNEANLADALSEHLPQLIRHQLV